MRRLVPAPLLSAALFVLWLLLNDSASAGHLLIALVLAVAVPLLSAPLRPQRGRISHPGVLLRLVVHVGHDVVVSAWQMAYGVLRAPWQAPRGAFVRVPLDLRDAHALAALAIITTVVPGTVWTELAPDRATILLHVWDVGDVSAFIAHYKQRYERPLQEIFE
jgi:multicomponent K+:H+ antiporter subunit E